MQLIDNLKAVKVAGVEIKSFREVETNRGIAWSCKVVLNGEKLGLVSNAGDGGMTHFEFGSAKQHALYDALKAAGYKLELTLGDYTAEEPTDPAGWVEFAVGQIGDEQKELKGYKRHGKSRVYVEQTDDKKVVYYKCEDTPANRQEIQSRHTGPIQFLNDLLAQIG